MSEACTFSANEPHPWTAVPGDGYMARPFWIVQRYCPGLPFNTQRLLTAGGGRARRFFNEGAAQRMATTLNATPPQGAQA